MATKALNYTTAEINQRLNLAGTAVQPNALDSYYTKTEVDGKVVVDLSTRYNTSYANLSAALTALNSDTATDATAIKKGGVSVKFINSSTNKYEQWILKASQFSTNVDNWITMSELNIITENHINSDVEVSDESGNVILRLKNGHIKTKNFDSENIIIPSDNITPNLNIDQTTFTGCVNSAIKLAQSTYPNARVVVITPLCQGSYSGAVYGGNQLTYKYPNAQGLYIKEYQERIKECAAACGVPCINIGQEFGVDFCNNSQLDIFAENGSAGTDHLHPNAAGHRLIGVMLANALNTHYLPLDGSTSWNGKNALFLGDSITSCQNGYVDENPSGNKPVYFAVVKQMLSLTKAKNGGFSGTGYTQKTPLEGSSQFPNFTYISVIERLTNKTYNYRDISEIDTTNYDLVCIFCGVNDYFGKTNYTDVAPMGDLYVQQ